MFLAAPPVVEDYTLLPIQEQLHNELLRDLYMHDDTALIAGTGVGKTVIAAHLIATLIKQYNPKLNGMKNPKAWSMALGARQIVFIVHLDTLVDQTEERLKDVFLSRYHNSKIREELNMWNGITKIKGGEKYNPVKPIVIASIQTLQRRYDKYIGQGIFNPAVGIYDEAHSTSFCETGIELAKLFGKRIGLTATPFRLDKKQWFAQMWQNVVVAPSVADLTEMKALCPVDYYQFVTADVTKGVRKGKYGWSEEKLRPRFDTEERIKYALDKWEEGGYGDLQTICFGIGITHVGNVVQAVRDRGHTAQGIDYTMAKEIRKPHFEAFRGGRLQFIGSVDALREGFDAKNIQCGMDLQPTTSIARHWQKIGRIMRLFPGKDMAYWLDFAGNIERLGFFGIPHMVELTPELVLSEKDITKRNGEAPTKFCVDNKFGKGCNAVNHASATKCKNPKCGLPFEKSVRDEGNTLQGEMVSVIRAGMVDDEVTARRFYRSIRIKRWIKGNDPNGAYFEFTESKVGDDLLCEKFPLPDPYTVRDEHKPWSVGAVTGKPSDFKTAQIYLGQLKAKAKKKRNPERFIDLNLYLEFDDDIYVKIRDEWKAAERKIEDLLFDDDEDETVAPVAV